MMEIQSQPTNLTKEDVIKLIADFQQNQCDEAQERLVEHYKILSIPLHIAIQKADRCMRILYK